MSKLWLAGAATVLAWGGYAAAAEPAYPAYGDAPTVPLVGLSGGARTMTLEMIEDDAATVATRGGGGGRGGGGHIGGGHVGGGRVGGGGFHSAGFRGGGVHTGFHNAGFRGGFANAGFRGGFRNAGFRGGWNGWRGGWGNRWGWRNGWGWNGWGWRNGWGWNGWGWGWPWWSGWSGGVYTNYVPTYYYYPYYVYPDYYNQYGFLPANGGVSVDVTEVVPSGPVGSSFYNAPPTQPRDGTYRYDGGPQSPVPLPQTRPDTTPPPAPRMVPMEGRTVSLPASGKYLYPAYGEQPRRTSFAEDRPVVASRK